MDLVGLSPPLLQLKELHSYPPEPSEISLKNNYVIVHHLMEIKDVQEVLWTTDSNISSPVESVPNHLIHIPPEVVRSDLAKLLHAQNHLSPSALIKMSPESPDYNQLSNRDQSPSPSMLPNGHLIPEVSSPTVELLLITESYSLDIPHLIG